MKKPITILAVLLLLSTTTFAAEYPSQVSYSMNNGIFEVRKTYELPVDQEPSMQAKQSFEQDGYSFYADRPAAAGTARTAVQRVHRNRNGQQRK